MITNMALGISVNVRPVTHPRYKWVATYIDQGKRRKKYFRHQSEALVFRDQREREVLGIDQEFDPSLLPEPFEQEFRRYEFVTDVFDLPGKPWGRSNSRGAYVYLIHDSEFYKIGRATEPLSRLAVIRTANPRSLSIRATWPCSDAPAVESSLQGHFRDCHISGEWFRLTEDQAEGLAEPEELPGEFQITHRQPR